MFGLLQFFRLHPRIQQCLVMFLIPWSLLPISSLYAVSPYDSFSPPFYIGIGTGFMTGKAMELQLPLVSTLSPREDGDAEFREHGLQFNIHLNSSQAMEHIGFISPTRWYTTISYTSFDVQFSSYEEGDEYLKNFEKTWDIYAGVQKNLLELESWIPFAEAGIGYRYEEALHSEFIKTEDWPWGPHSVLARGQSSSGQGLSLGFGGGYCFNEENSPNRYCIGVRGVVGPRSEGISTYVDDVAYLVRFLIYARYEIGIGKKR